MRFAIRLLRYQGRVLPWRQVVNAKPLVGDLRIAECMDPELKRSVRKAELFDPMIVIAHARPTLLDVHIISMGPQVFTLAGFERVSGQELAQSWLVMPSGD